VVEWFNRFGRPFQYYRILGVSRNATPEEIKQAYLGLVKIYHTDRNPHPTALKRLKMINKAYEVLSKPATKTDYDKSPAECPKPDCGTHEVGRKDGVYWVCRHCGCVFDPSKSDKGDETTSSSPRPEASSKLRESAKLFEMTQCSWCVKFFTREPLLCPPRRLQSSCFFFVRLSNEERTHLIADEKWWFQMQEMLGQVQERGLMAKCRHVGCGALNPNPQNSVCWQCAEDTLRCAHPKCEAKPVLRYDITAELWKCPSAGCSRTFVVRPKPDAGPTLSQEVCPKCRRNLYFSRELLLWKCKKCKRIYTEQDIRKARKKRGNQAGATQRNRAETKNSGNETGTAGSSAAETNKGSNAAAIPKKESSFRKSYTMLLQVLAVVAIVAIAINVYYLLTYQTLYGLWAFGFLLILLGVIALVFWVMGRL